MRNTPASEPSPQELVAVNTFLWTVVALAEGRWQRSCQGRQAAITTAQLLQRCVVLSSSSSPPVCPSHRMPQSDILYLSGLFTWVGRAGQKKKTTHLVDGSWTVEPPSSSYLQEKGAIKVLRSEGGRNLSNIGRSRVKLKRNESQNKCSTFFLIVELRLTNCRKKELPLIMSKVFI